MGRRLEKVGGYGLSIDLEGSHPKMCDLVKEAAERVQEELSNGTGYS